MRSALLASAAVKLDVLARLDNGVLIHLVLAAVSDSVRWDTPDLAELITNFLDGLTSDVAWLVVDTVSEVCHASGTGRLRIIVACSFHDYSYQTSASCLYWACVRLYGSAFPRPRSKKISVSSGLWLDTIVFWTRPRINAATAMLVASSCVPP